MPWLLIIIVSLVILFHLRLRYLNKNFDIEYDRAKYLEEERRANFSRARDIDKNMFITLSERDLPFRANYDESVPLERELIRIQNRVKLNLEMPIIKTDIKTNTEVKRRFGASNLQTVIDGEENFTKLIQHLNQWAKYLIEAGNVKDAEMVLDSAVASRSDISETYILLYGLYESSGRQSRMLELKKSIDNLPEIAKIKVCKFIGERE